MQLWRVWFISIQGTRLFGSVLLSGVVHLEFWFFGKRGSGWRGECVYAEGRSTAARLVVG